jgi:hypothetical protein
MLPGRPFVVYFVLVFRGNRAYLLFTKIKLFFLWPGAYTLKPVGRHSVSFINFQQQ